jgi:uncharacterized protein
MPAFLAAAFAAGLAGSLHCVAMCGGISGALGMRARSLGAAPGRVFAHAAGYQAGRIASYTAAGALCGASGGALTALFDLDRIAFALRVFAGLLMIALSLRVLFGWRLLDGLERMGARFWAQLAPLAQRTRGGGLGASLLLGAIWGWLPCGLIYSMLIFAALSGSAVRGAATMLLFGAGTLPAMLSGSLISARAWALKGTRGLRAAAGVLLFGFGLVTALGPLWHALGLPMDGRFAVWCMAH